MNKKLLTLISSLGLLHSAFAADCVITETHFDANVNLCCPTMASDATGWYAPTLDVSTVCKGDMTTGLEHVKHLGLPAALSTSGSSVWDKDKFDDMFVQYYVGPDASGTQYGASAVTAQPKLLHPFIKANTSANGMFVNLGSLRDFPFLVYSISGFEPGSDVTLTFDVSSLMDESYFEYLTTEVCVGAAGKRLTDFINDYTYSGGAISSSKPLSVSVVSSDQSYTVDNSNNGVLSLASATPTTKIVDFGATETVTHKATASPSGSVSFVFYRSTDCFKVPLGIDNLKVTGSVQPQIVYSGNPCPMQELRVFTKQSFPEGTKYTWKESVTGQSSTDKVFRFEPQAANTKYTVTCSVKLPDCDEIFDAEPIDITSGTCCENNGHPMAMKNIFFDDFGTFVSDDTYEWTDRSGMIHTETIPSNQVHEAQSVGEKIPYVKAYNIEYSGATLDIPFLGDNLPRDFGKQGIKTQLYDHGVYLISKRGGYGGGVMRDADNSENGGMLQFDLQDEIAENVFCEECPMDQFFNIDINHICVGTKINFSAELAAINNINGGIEVSLEYGNKSYFYDKVVFEKDNPGIVEKWHSVKGELEIKPEDVDANTEEIQIKMKLSHYPYYSDGVTIIPAGESSRDYAVDNILFQVCTPPDVDVDALLTGGTSLLELCSNETLELKAAVSSSTLEYYDNITYLFQWSNQDPDVTDDEDMVWHDLENELREKYLSEGSIKITNPSSHVAFSNIKEGTEENVYFRVVIGDRNYLTTTDIWKKQSAFNPCRAVSISTIPIKAGLKCTACEPVKEASIISRDPVTEITTNAKGEKEVTLCPGKTAYLTTEAFEPTDPTVMGIEQGPDDEPRKYIASWHKGSKTAAGKPGIGYAAGNPTSDFNVNWEEDGWYYLLVKDIEFPDGENCYKWDSIHVIAGEKPDKTLDNPEFCKGLAGVENDTTKTIAGYKIKWYDGADTATSIPEPALKDLENSKSYWYVVVDESTGCVGEVTEYGVTVNSAMANTVEGKITYNKSTDFETSGKAKRDLKAQDRTPFTANVIPTEYDLMIGLVKGETSETEPDVKTLSASSFGTASKNQPKPEITASDLEDPDDQYMYYYTYLKNNVTGCLSDTLLIKVVIKGAPSPDTKDASYCVNSEKVNPFKSYATASALSPNDPLSFWEDEAATIPVTGTAPDVSQPGTKTYYATQEGAGGKSKAVPFKITVYGVADVKLSEATTKYCLEDAATPVEGIVSSDPTSGEIIGEDVAEWEFFKDLVPSTSTRGKSSMAVETGSAGTTLYYARLKYELAATEVSPADVCYGKHEEYAVEVVKVEPPLVSGVISYQKDEGANGGFKKPTDPDKTTISGDASCSTCGISWYSAKDESKEITVEAATPVYSADMDEVNKTYYLRQSQQITSNKTCWSEFTDVNIMVSVYPMPQVKNISMCADSSGFTGTIQAQASDQVDGSGAVKTPASDFTLLWYKSKADGTIDENTECASISLDPSVQKAGTDGKPKEYIYWVRQRLTSSTVPPYAQGAPAKVIVTVYPIPVLTVSETTPKCHGETQDLSELFTVQPVECDASYVDEETHSSETTKSIVDKGGQYNVRGYYFINDGDGNKFVCKSGSKALNVVFHTVTAEIEGPETTCPGVGVGLKAKVDVKVKGSTAAATVKYDWSNNKNSETGTAETYNTGTDGLANKDDKMKVSLEVSTEACKGATAIKADDHTIKVGDGQLSGSIAFSEPNNTDEKEVTLQSSTTSAITFNSCGGNVKASLVGVDNQDGEQYSGGEYKLSGPVTKIDNFSKKVAGAATIDGLKAGRYKMEYVNKCKASFEFEIVDYSMEATPSNDPFPVCEGESWKASINITKKADEPTIEWKKDDGSGAAVIPGETGTTLQFSPAKPSDSGVYTYTLTSAGCHLDGKIATGNKVKIQPYAQFDASSYETAYEVVDGNTLDINLKFTVPSTQSEIADDVKWEETSGDYEPNGASMSLAITKDYEWNISAKNNDFCLATTNIVVKVDKRLEVVPEIAREEICEGESTTITFDTHGTNDVLHPEKLNVSLAETTVDGTNPITLENKGNGIYEARVSPVHDAAYSFTYTYTNNNVYNGDDQTQDQSITSGLEITVHENFDVRLSSPEPVCEGDYASVSVLKLYPDGTELDWSGISEVVTSSNSGATFSTKHEGSGVATDVKHYEVIAKNGICEPTPFSFDVKIDKAISGEIDCAQKICEHDELSLDATSYQADTYEWKYWEKDSTFTGAKAALVPDPYSASFQLHMERGKCSLDVDKEVEVTSVPAVYRVDSLDIRKVEVVLEAGAGTGPFKYIIDGNESDPDIDSEIRDGLEYREHTVKVIDAVGCESEFKFTVKNPQIVIPFVVSPDGNGVNDKFTVKGLASGYPDAKVTIFDRWGKELAKYRAGDGTDWDGTYNGSAMPSTDYWYEIQIKEIKKTYTGHFTLIRQ